MNTPKSKPIPPPSVYSQEAEEAVLGGLLMSPDLFGIVASIITASDFFIVRHGYIFEAMANVVRRREPLDYTTLTNELRANGNLEMIGGGIPGTAYLAQLINNLGSSYNTDIYAGLVKRCAVRRRLLQGSDDMRELALNETIPLEDVLNGSEKIITTIRRGARIEQGEVWQSIVSRLIDRVEGRMNGNAEAFGLPSGFKELDNFTTGFKSSSLTIIGGRAGMGKTALMLSMALNQLVLGARIGFISQEMDRDELAERLIAMSAGINMQAIRTGQMTDSEWARFLQATERSLKWGLYVDDAAGLTVNGIRGKVLQWDSEGGVDAVYADYLQIIKPDDAYRGNRTNEVSAIARDLKDMAKGLRKPVIAAAQINRAVEGRQDKRPTMADLRESGEIEAAADNIILLYREDYYGGEKTGDTELILAKQRNGPTGSAWAKFIAETTRYADGVLNVQSFEEMGK